MDLGLERDEVRIVPYNKDWSEEFNNQKTALIDKLDIENCRIEHIGSTAIINMASKPIIDIILGIDNFNIVNDNFQKKLSEIGFLRLRVEKDNEIVFAKFKDTEYNIKTHYLHITIYNGKLWNDLINFRDILNNNDELKKEYHNIKLDYLRNTNTGIVDYTNHKEEFVNKIKAVEI